MLSVARSPLTSPALRTAIAISSNTSFSIHHVVPPSPLSHLPQGPQMKTPGSPGLRTLRYPSSDNANSFPFGEHSSVEISTTSPAPPRVPASSQFGILKSTRRRSTANASELKLTSSPGSVPAKAEQTNELKTPSQMMTESRLPAAGHDHARTTRRPSFKLELPPPLFTREDSFKAVALAGISHTLDSPGDLEWSDSGDSVVTLKPTKGRVATPYPKLDGEWIEEGDLAHRVNVASRLSLLV